MTDEQILRLEKSINKALIEDMPYLQPRNVWTDEIPKDYDYEYIRGEHELPEGWFNLFLDMCADIKKPLEKSGHLDSFRFTQIKEKFGSLRAYNNGCTEEVDDILLKYERISRFTCNKCGRLATKESRGYILPYCKHCAKIASKGKYPEKFDNIRFNPTIKISGYKNGKKYKRRLNCLKEFLLYHLNRNNKTPFEIVYGKAKEESK